jgi:hypothetical protein
VVVSPLTEITGSVGSDGCDLDFSQMLLSSAIAPYPRQPSSQQLIHQGPSQLIGSSITHYLCHCKYLGKSVTFGEEYPSTPRSLPAHSLGKKKSMPFLASDGKRSQNPPDISDKGSLEYVTVVTHRTLGRRG